MKKNSFTIIMIITGVVVAGGIITLIYASADSSSDTNELATGTNVGDRAPDFRIKVIDGQEIALSDFLGEKALLITSTASWCPTCIVEANNISPVYAEYSDTVEFLSVSVDPTDDRLKLESLSANTNSPWFYTEPNLSGVTDMIIDYRLTRFEITYVINREGIIIFKDKSITTEETLTEIMQSLSS